MKNFTQSLLDLWKQLGLNQRVSLGLAAAVVVVGFVALGQQQRDVRGVVLPVGVQHHDDFPAGVVDPGRQRRRLAGVAAQAQSLEPRALAAQLLDHGEGVVG